MINQFECQLATQFHNIRNLTIQAQARLKSSKKQQQQQHFLGSLQQIKLLEKMRSNLSERQTINWIYYTRLWTEAGQYTTTSHRSCSNYTRLSSEDHNTQYKMTTEDISLWNKLYPCLWWSSSKHFNLNK